MTTGINTLRYSYSPNGTDDVLGEWSPSAGELYYVDKVVQLSNGAGSYSNSSLGARVSIYPKNAGITPHDIPNGGTPNSYGGGKCYGNELSSSEDPIERYLTDEHALGVLEADQSSDSCTITIVIYMRQVL